MTIRVTEFPPADTEQHDHYGCYRYGIQGDHITPTPYYRRQWKSSKSGEGQYKDTGTGIRMFNFNKIEQQGIGAHVHNAALASLDGKLRIADSFFEDWYERKQSYDLLVSAGKNILKFLKNYKNPKYYKGLYKKSEAADLPSAWLAYNFGVKPMVGSVDRALKLLGADFPIWRVSGTSSFTIKEDTYVIPGYYGGNVYTSHRGQFKIGCSVTGINPNVALAGALGLNEPLSSAWNVLPWGWAVDYFFNVGDLLSNFENNHPGLIVDHYYQTTTYNSTTSAGYSGPVEDYHYNVEGRAFTMKRERASRPIYRLETTFPLLGSNQAANLFSAIALTMKGKK